MRPGAHGAPGSSPGTRHPHGDSVRAWRSHEIACVKCLAERWHLVRLDKWEVLCCHRGKVCFEQRPVKWRSEADFRAAMPAGGNALSFRPRAGSGYSRPISNAAQSTEPLKFKVDLWPGPPPLPPLPPKGLPALALPRVISHQGGPEERVGMTQCRPSQLLGHTPGQGLAGRGDTVSVTQGS